MQFQSGGVYRQQQIIASLTARYSRFSIFSFYTYNNAHADTSGVNYSPSVASHPGLDYGRANFDMHNRFVLLGSIIAPWQISFSPFISANSGTPYNLTTGKDLTGNNQFNSRPTFALSCSQPNAVSTPYGCLDADPLTSPTGSSEKIIPYNLGTGPANVSLNLRISKVIGFGPRVQGASRRRWTSGWPARRWTRPPRPERKSRRVWAFECHDCAQIQPDLFRLWPEIFNHENLGTPNGTLTSPFFGKSQSLAGGFFGPSTAGNRSIFLSASLTF